MFPSRFFNVFSPILFDNPLFCVWFEVNIKFHFYPPRYPTDLAPFIVKITFSPQNCRGSVVEKSGDHIHEWVYFCKLHTVPLTCLCLYQYYTVLIIVAFYKVLVSVIKAFQLC